MAKSKQTSGHCVLSTEVKVKPMGQEFHVRELGGQG